jgi:DNA-binding transcriptional LysR family regulator
MDITLRQLAYVSAAANLGSFSGAAQHLGVSQASISATTAAIERRLGVHLFKRHSSRGVTLTPSGDAFMREARSLLEHVERFWRHAEGLQEPMKPGLTIGAQVSIAARVLPGLIDECPEIVVEVREEPDHEGVITALLAGRCEWGLAAARDLDPRVQGLEIGVLPPYAILSRKHPLATRPAVRLADCATAPFLANTAAGTRGYFDDVFDSVQIQPRIAFRATSCELLRALVGRDLGFAIELGAPPEGASADGLPFVAIPFVESLPRLKILAYRPADRPLAAAAAPFDRALRRLADARQ